MREACGQGPAMPDADKLTPAGRRRPSLKRPAEFWRRITPSFITSTDVVLLVEDTCVMLSRSFSIFLAIINRPGVHPGTARSIRGHPGIGHCVSRYGVLACGFSLIRLLRRSINFRSPTPAVQPTGARRLLLLTAGGRGAVGK